MSSVTDYTIKKTNGSTLATVSEFTVDKSTTPIALIGKLVPNYGSIQSENFIHLLENFANVAFPKNPLVGQLCFITESEDEANYSSNTMYFWDGNVWKKFFSLLLEESENPQPGDAYYDTINHKFKIYDSELNDWVVIGPASLNNDFKVAEKGQSDASTKTAIFEIPLTKGNSYMVESKIIAQEVGGQGERLETCAWIYRYVVRCLENFGSGSPITEIIGDPSYDLIACTDGVAKNWKIEIDTNGIDTIIITCYGLGTSNNMVNWTVSSNIISVDNII